MHEYISSLMNRLVHNNKKAISKLRSCNRSMNLPPIVQEAINFRIADLEDENELIYTTFPHHFIS